MSANNTGWIPPSQRTKEQTELDEAIKSSMPRFALPVKDEGRYQLWKLAEKGLKRKLQYAHQLTGSCVGAGGYSCSLTLMGVEIALGEAEEFQQIFWPWTYGQSRRLGGLNGQGEGSFGTAYFKAARECGYFAVSEGYDLALPQFRVVDGWLQLSREAELKYSNGAAFAGEPYASRAKKHLINQGAQAFTVPDALGLLQSGYPLTIASLMGTRTITPQGNGENRVNVAKWDDKWAHQMFIDEAWKNPDLGWIFRVGNNWGNAAHPAPVNDSPGGGFYITEATLDKNLKSGDCELFGFGGLAGFPAREIDWYI